ncbi:MAG TPA: cysteine hydrolase [Acidimicrobiales bacterium]|jgi:nicotinamidase-related amidase|nr:cysteine hydrolase [Acidimicrobiales bacterium]
MSIRAALLVMDVQNGMVEAFGNDEAYLGRVAAAVSGARSASIPVIYVRVAFRPGLPEVSSTSKSFAGLKSAAQHPFGEDDDATRVHPAVAPLPGEVVVTKRRSGAFTGSDLDVVLRAGEIDTLVLTGMATSGVVLSTTRAAADRDFSLIVLSDGCLDGDPEVHRVLTEKVFPKQADVMTVAEWLTTLISATD